MKFDFIIQEYSLKNQNIIDFVRKLYFRDNHLLLAHQRNQLQEYNSYCLMKELQKRIVSQINFIFWCFSQYLNYYDSLYRCYTICLLGAFFLVSLFFILVSSFDLVHFHYLLYLFLNTDHLYYFQNCCLVLDLIHCFAFEEFINSFENKSVVSKCALH